MNNSYKVALLLNTSRPYGRKLTEGVIRYSQLYGPWSFYLDDQFYLSRPSKSNMSYLKKWEVDGIITRDFKEASILTELGVPIITARNQGYLDSQVQIRTKDAEIGKMAFDFFRSKGVTNFGYCGFQNMPWSQRRENGYNNSVAKAGFKTHIYNSHSSKRMLHRNMEYTNIAQWLENIPKPIGILSCNDDRGYDIIECCRIARLNVPNDIAVLGVDDDNLVCNLANPKLSSVIIDIEQAGFDTASAMHKMMAGRTIPPKDIIVKPLKVAERHSTDIMAIEDDAVKEALEFIRKHSHQLIQTEDVAEAVGISRRSLESRFRKIIGHSVFVEIRRKRIEKICSLLIETDLTITKIALMLGYNDSDHIARFFKKEKNMTPKQFRNLYGFNKTHLQ